MQAALGELWIFTGELFETDDLVRRLVEARVVFDPEALRAPWREEVLGTFAEAGLEGPKDPAWMQRGGRDGRHGEALGRMLSEMQSVARVFPGARW
jgi:ring-1,2-phenylacetyl-CoA epoxidase subunit PaaC